MRRGRRRNPLDRAAQANRPTEMEAIARVTAVTAVTATPTPSPLKKKEGGGIVRACPRRRRRPRAVTVVTVVTVLLNPRGAAGPRPQAPRASLRPGDRFNRLWSVRRNIPTGGMSRHPVGAVRLVVTVVVPGE
jgi:hypothetical protein